MPWKPRPQPGWPSPEPLAFLLGMRHNYDRHGRESERLADGPMMNVAEHLSYRECVAALEVLAELRLRMDSLPAGATRSAAVAEAADMMRELEQRRRQFAEFKGEPTED